MPSQKPPAPQEENPEDAALRFLLRGKPLNTSGQAAFQALEQGRAESDVIVEDSGFGYSFARAPLMKLTSCRASYQNPADAGEMKGRKEHVDIQQKTA